MHRRGQCWRPGSSESEKRLDSVAWGPMLVQRVTHAAISTAGLALAVALSAAGLCPLATEAQAKSDAVANDARVAGDRERTQSVQTGHVRQAGA